MRIAGIMSGTSLDGIDVAVIEFNGQNVTTLGHLTTPYPDPIRQRIIAVSNTNCHTREISRLNYQLPELYAKAVQETCANFAIDLATIELVGCHGQTIYHEGAGSNRNTLQIGNPATLAERLDVTVVSDFRARDIAAGGSGAPLVPFVDQLLFSSGEVPRVALNIGGIANITVLAPGTPVIAFDTGPGNMVIDQLVELYTDGSMRYDRGGQFALDGRIDEELLQRLLRSSYLQASPPKTAGREEYGSDFVNWLVTQNHSLLDLIATATDFTAASIALAVERFAPATRELIAAGGGVHNPQIMGALARRLEGTRVTTTAEFGIDPDAKEAVAFAVLAYQTIHGLPGNVPSATGAAHRAILGSITPAYKYGRKREQ